MGEAKRRKELGLTHRGPKEVLGAVNILEGMIRKLVIMEENCLVDQKNGMNVEARLKSLRTSKQNLEMKIEELYAKLQNPDPE
jgi:hypothetical protein